MIKILVATLLALFAVAGFAAVDANTATQAELEGIKGVGAALSSRIVEERRKSPFKDWQDMITRVKGVGEHNSAKFSTSGLTVNGAAFVAPPVMPSKVQSDAPAQAPKSATKLDTSKPAGARPQSGEPVEADRAAKKAAPAVPDAKKEAGAKIAAVDTPQSSAPVTAPVGKTMTAEERKAARQKAKDDRAAAKAEKAAKKKEKADAAAAAASAAKK